MFNINLEEAELELKEAKEDTLDYTKDLDIFEALEGVQTTLNIMVYAETSKRTKYDIDMLETLLLTQVINEEEKKKGWFRKTVDAVVNFFKRILAFFGVGKSKREKDYKKAKKAIEKERDDLKKKVKDLEKQLKEEKSSSNSKASAQNLSEDEMEDRERRLKQLEEENNRVEEKRKEEDRKREEVLKKREEELDNKIAELKRKKEELDKRETTVSQREDDNSDKVIKHTEEERKKLLEQQRKEKEKLNKKRQEEDEKRKSKFMGKYKTGALLLTDGTKRTDKEVERINREAEKRDKEVERINREVERRDREVEFRKIKHEKALKNKAISDAADKKARDDLALFHKYSHHDLFTQAKGDLGIIERKGRLETQYKALIPELTKLDAAIDDINKDITIWEEKNKKIIKDYIDKLNKTLPNNDNTDTESEAPDSKEVSEYKQVLDKYDALNKKIRIFHSRIIKGKFGSALFNVIGTSNTYSEIRFIKELQRSEVVKYKVPNKLEDKYSPFVWIAQLKTMLKELDDMTTSINTK